MTMNKLARRLLTAVAGILLTAWSMPLIAEDATAIYKTKCAACHGPDGKGDTAVGKKFGVRDFASPEVQKQSDDELAAIINDGKNKMPAYKKSLKPEQVKDLVAFIHACGKK
jgi:mono/diheme cytochrome c family protein